MNKKTTQPILLIGTGPIGIEYANILKSLDQNVIAVGRSETSCNIFFTQTGIRAVSGGFQEWQTHNERVQLDETIIAVSENELGSVALQCLKSGIKKIFIEKPGGSTFDEIRKVGTFANEKRAQVFIGYNRRQYASVQMCKKMIQEDGGVTSFNFEFTEWGHVISDLAKAPGVKEEWFLHNSTHVIDLAFYLGGYPLHMNTFVKGSLPWHKNAAIFAGAGESTLGALFSYQANWAAPGRWGVEILTAKHRLILRPLEKLQIQNIGSVGITEVPIDDEWDKQFKPGFYQQTKYFIEEQYEKLCSIEEQVEHCSTFEAMLQNSIKKI